MTDIPNTTGRICQFCGKVWRRECLGGSCLLYGNGGETHGASKVVPAINRVVAVEIARVDVLEARVQSLEACVRLLEKRDSDRLIDAIRSRIPWYRRWWYAITRRP